MAAEKGPHSIIVELIPSINRQFYIFWPRAPKFRTHPFSRSWKALFYPLLQREQFFKKHLSIRVHLDGFISWLLRALLL